MPNRTINEVVEALLDRRVIAVYVTPITKHGEFETCRCFLEFEAGNRLELAPCAADEMLEYPAQYDGELLPLDLVDGFRVVGMVFRGILISKSIYSLCVVLDGRPLLGICLDTQAGIRLSPTCYSIPDLLRDHEIESFTPQT